MLRSVRSSRVGKRQGPEVTQQADPVVDEVRLPPARGGPLCIEVAAYDRRTGRVSRGKVRRDTKVSQGLRLPARGEVERKEPERGALHSDVGFNRETREYHEGGRQVHAGREDDGHASGSAPLRVTTAGEWMTLAPCRSASQRA